MTMVLNWLTSYYLPLKFWYFPLKIAAQVSNYMPILLENGQLTTSYEQIYVTKPDWHNLVPIFSIGYIHINWDGNKQRAASTSQSITGIYVGNDPEGDGLLLYIPTSKKLVVLADYRLDPTVLSGPVFGYSYDGGIGFNLYNSSTNANFLLSQEKEEYIYFKKYQCKSIRREN